MSTLNIKKTTLAVAILSLLSFQSEAVTSNVAAGNTFGLFIQNGTVFGSGSTDYGTLGATGDAPYTHDIRKYTPINIGIINAKSVSASGNRSIALKSTGLAYWWGMDTTTSPYRMNLNPTLVPVTNLLDVATSNKNIIVLQNSGNGVNGKVWTWSGSTSTVPVLVVGLPDNIVSIAAGEDHFIALDAFGNIYTWGNNNLGQLGRLTTTTLSLVADIVPGVTNVKSISAGGNSTMVVHSDGTVTGWGTSTYGQVGNGQAVPTNQFVVPTKSTFLKNVKKATVGVSASIITSDAGVTYGLGWHNYINAGTYNLTTNTTAIINELHNVEYSAVGAGGFYLTEDTSGKFENWGQAGGIGTGSLIETHSPNIATMPVGTTAVWADPEQVAIDLVNKCNTMSLNDPLYTTTCGISPVVTLQDQVLALQDTITVVQANNTQLTTSLSILQQDNTNLVVISDGLSTTNSGLQAQVATLTTTTTDLQNQVVVSTTENNTLHTQVLNDSATIVSLQSQIDALTNARDALQAQVTTLSIKPATLTPIITQSVLAVSCKTTDVHHDNNEHNEHEEHHDDNKAAKLYEDMKEAYNKVKKNFDQYVSKSELKTTRK